MMKQPVVKISQKTHQKYTEAIAEFVCGDLIPLSTVDSKHFQGMIKLVSGGAYEPPSGRYIIDTILPKMYCETVQSMEKEMAVIGGIRFTTDGWTSMATESYISTYHRHTAENLAKDMDQIEKTCGIDKLLFNPVYLHDNASNVTKDPKLMETPRLGIGCLAHAINLAACSATSVDEVSKLIDKGRGLVTAFKKSTIASNVLKMKQKLLFDGKNKKLIQDCPTRWNSSYMKTCLTD